MQEFDLAVENDIECYSPTWDISLKGSHFKRLDRSTVNLTLTTDLSAMPEASRHIQSPITSVLCARRRFPLPCQWKGPVRAKTCRSHFPRDHLSRSFASAIESRSVRRGAESDYARRTHLP